MTLRTAVPPSSPIIRMLSTGMLLALALLTAVPTPATEARLIALGGVGDYIEDDRNLKRWYGCLLDYPDLVTFDSGYFGIDGYPRYSGVRLSGPAFGGSVNLAGDGSWGTLGLFMDGKSHPGNTGNLASETVQLGALTALYGLNLGGVQTVATARYFGNEDEFEGDPGSVLESFKETRRQWQLGLGVRLDLGENAYLDLAGEIRNHYLNTEIVRIDQTHQSGDQSSWGNLGLRGRAFVALGERTALVPVVEYLSEDRPLSWDALWLASEQDGHLWRLGCGLNFLPDIDSLIFLAVDVQTSEIELQHSPILLGQNQDIYQSRQWDAFSVRLGLEKRFQSWLTLRAATGYLHSNDELKGWVFDPTDPLEVQSTEIKRIPLSIGLAGHLGAWDLNLAVTNEQPLHSPLDTPSEFYVVPGNPTWLAVSLAFGF